MGFEPAINFTKAINWFIFVATWLKIMKNIWALISCMCWHWIAKKMSASITSPPSLSIAYETLVFCAVVIGIWIKYQTDHDLIQWLLPCSALIFPSDALEENKSRILRLSKLLFSHDWKKKFTLAGATVLHFKSDCSASKQSYSAYTSFRFKLMSLSSSLSSSYGTIKCSKTSLWMCVCSVVSLVVRLWMRVWQSLVICS